MRFVDLQYILSAHWDGVLPVDPVKIATSMGISCYGRGGAEDESYPYSGRFYIYSGTPTIEYNVTESAVRQRFIAAHELGHFLQGIDDAEPDAGEVWSSTSHEDLLANKFAYELTMPENLVRYHYERVGSVEELAGIFGVSTDAMGYRLRSLNIVYF